MVVHPATAEAPSPLISQPTATQVRTISLRREDGQAVVELALVIPLLLILLFGIIDFGEALNQYNDTTNLANLGARAAIVASGTTVTSPPDPSCVSGTTTAPTDLVGYLQCEGATDSASLASVKVCALDMTNPNAYLLGDTIQVKVDEVFSWFQILVGGVGKLGGSVPSLTSTISSTATMREESNITATPSWIAGTGTTTNSTGC